MNRSGAKVFKRGGAPNAKWLNVKRLGSNILPKKPGELSSAKIYHNKRMPRSTLSRWILGLFLIVLLYLVFVLGYGAATDWQPEPETVPLERPGAEGTVIADSLLTLAIWNVGYGGLGAESDFFYDDGGFFFAHGKMIRADRELVEKNVAGQSNFAGATPADFYLLQEVDYDSKRSYGINQFENFGNQLPGFHGSFAANYRNDRVPIPIAEPWRAYGYVHSGLATFSDVRPREQIRYQLPGAFGFPTRLFQLDRCALLTRYATRFGPDLVLINVHNSAYDSDGSLKRQQMEFLKNLALPEYEAGNYVVIGGDWNQTPPYFPYQKFMDDPEGDFPQIEVAPDFLPDNWTYAYDPTRPTNRKTKTPYVEDETFVTLIDFFVVSPNVRVRRVRGVDQKFAFSDHQPVVLTAELLQPRPRR